RRARSRRATPGRCALQRYRLTVGQRQPLPSSSSSSLPSPLPSVGGVGGTVGGLISQPLSPPSSPSSSSSSSSSLPGGMPLETYSPMLVPDPTLAPDSGLVRTTSPLSRSEFTSPDTDASNPSSASFLVASSTVMPRTSGTCVETPSMLPGSGFLKSYFG